MDARITEIELKFSLDPASHALLRRASVLAPAHPSRRRTSSLYLDTPDCELAKREMALRLRQTGRRWVQTLKAGRSGTGGLHAREEWEYPRSSPEVDLALFAHTPLRDMPRVETLHERLVPAFEVNLVRTAWHLAPAPGSRLEVVLDFGAVESRGHREAISEIEIECVEGDASHAFDLAARLLEEVPLHPSAVTKAQRGYRLFRGARARPVKAGEVRLDEAMTTLAAARAVIGAGLDQLQANEEGLLTATDPEFVHQARIALRRTRGALRMFRDVVGAERAEGWRTALDEVARSLGAARDWDVFATQTFPAVAAAYGDATLARALARRGALRRRRERETARLAVRSPRYARVILDFARWLAEDAPAQPAVDGEPITAFASRVVRKRHKRLLADANRLSQLSVAVRHKVRIDAKRLRYSVDGLASVFNPKRVKRYTQSLAALQDALGQTNDAATAARLLAELEPPRPFAAFARGWFAARAQGDPAALEALVKRLGATRRFWLKKIPKDAARS